MTRKLMLVGLTLTIIAGLALSGIGKTERAVVKAEAAASAPFFGACDPISNVKVKALPRNDFEITWEFNPPGSCLVPDGFDIEVRAKRNAGGGLLGKRNIRANAGERRVVVNFRSIAGFDIVDATVGTKIKFEPFGQGSSGKL